MLVLAYNVGPHSLLEYLIPRIYWINISRGTDYAVIEHCLARCNETKGAILHVDATNQECYPADRKELLRYLDSLGCTCWNRRLGDLSKPAIQAWNVRLGLPTTRAEISGEPTEQVIIKTAANCRGLAERRLDTTNQLPSSALGVSTPLFDRFGDYRVLPRSDVSSAFWRDDHLFIERFVPNSTSFIRVILFGSQTLLLDFESNAQVKRTHNSILKQIILGTRDVVLLKVPSLTSIAHERACQFADAIGLDCGAIDLVLSPAEPYIVDVNAIPWWNEAMPFNIRLHLLEHTCPYLLR